MKGMGRGGGWFTSMLTLHSLHCEHASLNPPLPLGNFHSPPIGLKITHMLSINPASRGTVQVNQVWALWGSMSQEMWCHYKHYKLVWVGQVPRVNPIFAKCKKRGGGGTIGLCVWGSNCKHVSYVNSSIGIWVAMHVMFCRDGKQIPNLLALFTGSESPNAQGEMPRSCSVCGGERCQRQHPSAAIPLSTHAHVTCSVPQSVDEALEEVREWRVVDRWGQCAVRNIQP